MNALITDVYTSHMGQEKKDHANRNVFDEEWEGHQKEKEFLGCFSLEE